MISFVEAGEFFDGVEQVEHRPLKGRDPSGCFGLPLQRVAPDLAGELAAIRGPLVRCFRLSVLLLHVTHACKFLFVSSSFSLA